MFQSPNICHRETILCTFSIRWYCSPTSIIRLGPPVTPLWESDWSLPPPSRARWCTLSSSLGLPSVSLGFGLSSHHQQPWNFTDLPHVRLSVSPNDFLPIPSWMPLTDCLTSQRLRSLPNIPVHLVVLGSRGVWGFHTGRIRQSPRWS